jgi:hypothetical protein
VLLLAVAVAVAVGGQPQFVVGHPIATTVQPGVIPSDKVVKAEHKLPVALAVYLGHQLLREGLQEHWVTEVKQGFGKLHLAVAVAAASTVVVVVVTTVVVPVPMAAVAVVPDHL